MTNFHVIDGVNEEICEPSLRELNQEKRKKQFVAGENTNYGDGGWYLLDGMDQIIDIKLLRCKRGIQQPFNKLECKVDEEELNVQLELVRIDLNNESEAKQYFESQIDKNGKVIRIAAKYGKSLFLEY